ncbi:uncharacterized protein PHACADRAFT_182947 [Phanerochaete carnosa HHB-10118-sp]|uniref:F-box domain-containing protein n=1 Tax=Phanerochaete carnosa (strain HHB-10118-sp) TaxID=650164 RepID=K5WH75_PHACS|nr:uncharacterized protein PHACADRAFT_182947 [Phanerochaete carnosa HHB-10118-sp]EKM58685.1 hypothetical protein PHACADRAFT_182947 [Phanerochaete carnosa HHB-10118-sp]
MCKSSASEPNSTVAVRTERCEPPTPRVPVELQDMIIDNLRGDKETLAYCSLVCRSWLAPSQRHLFFSLLLRVDRRCPNNCLGCNGEPPSGRTLVDVKDFLVGSPRIGSYVQETRFIRSSTRSGRYPLKANLLLDILDVVPRLRVLEFHCIGIRGDFHATELKDNFLAFVSAIPCLKKLVFNTTNICRTPSIANSSLPAPVDFSQATVSTGPGSPVHPFSLPLECLKILRSCTDGFAFEPVLDVVTARPDSLSSLRRLTINLACEHSPAAIYQSFHGMYLKYTSLTSSQALNDALHLPVCKSLANLTLRMSTFSHYQPFATSVCLMANAILQLLPLSIASVNLVLDFDVAYLQAAPEVHVLIGMLYVVHNILSTSHVKTVTLTTSGCAPDPRETAGNRRSLPVSVGA